MKWCCPFCEKPMIENHTRFWTGQRNVLLKASLRCLSTDHRFDIMAKDEESLDKLGYTFGLSYEIEDVEDDNEMV